MLPPTSRIEGNRSRSDLAVRCAKIYKKSTSQIARNAPVQLYLQVFCSEKLFAAKFPVPNRLHPRRPDRSTQLHLDCFHRPPESVHR